MANCANDRTDLMNKFNAVTIGITCLSVNIVKKIEIRCYNINDKQNL